MAFSIIIINNIQSHNIFNESIKLKMKSLCNYNVKKYVDIIFISIELMNSMEDNK